MRRLRVPAPSLGRLRSTRRTRQRGGAGRYALVAAVLLGSLGSTALITQATSAAFNAGTTNSGNANDSGSVVLSDDDGGSAIFTSMTAPYPGDSETRCVTVTYTGTLAAQVRLRGSVGGTGLASYL